LSRWAAVFPQGVEKQGTCRYRQRSYAIWKWKTDKHTFAVKAEFEVLPQIDWAVRGPSKQKQPAIHVTDEEREERTEAVQERHGSYDPVD